MQEVTKLEPSLAEMVFVLGILRKSNSTRVVYLTKETDFSLTLFVKKLKCPEMNCQASSWQLTPAVGEYKEMDTVTTVLFYQRIRIKFEFLCT